MGVAGWLCHSGGVDVTGTRVVRWFGGINEIWNRRIKDRGNPYLMLDATIVKAHQQAVTAEFSEVARLPGP